MRSAASRIGLSDRAETDRERSGIDGERMSVSVARIVEAVVMRRIADRMSVISHPIRATTVPLRAAARDTGIQLNLTSEVLVLDVARRSGERRVPRAETGTVGTGGRRAYSCDRVRMATRSYNADSGTGIGDARAGVRSV